MPTPQKEQVVNQLVEKLEGAKTIILTDYSGMDVLSISELRKKCREAHVEYKVVKNTLTRLAAERTKYAFLVQHLDGPIALALSAVDELAPARVIVQFKKDHELPKIKLGLVEGFLLKAEHVERLASLPPRNVLLGQFAGALRRPLTMLSFALTLKLRQLLVALNEVKDKKTQ